MRASRPSLHGKTESARAVSTLNPIRAESPERCLLWPLPYTSHSPAPRRRCTDFAPPLCMMTARRDPMRESASTAFLLSVLDDAVFVADESAILLANPAFEELIEFTSAELASPRPPCFACPEEQITFFAFVQRQLSEGGTAPGQHAALVNLVARNGGPLVVQVKFRPFTPSKEDGGRPTCFYFASDKLKWREVCRRRCICSRPSSASSRASARGPPSLTSPSCTPTSPSLTLRASGLRSCAGGRCVPVG